MAAGGPTVRPLPAWKLPPDLQAAGFRDEIAQAARGRPDDFFTWLNAAADAEDSFQRGAAEYSSHIGCHLDRHLDARRVILEIGYGGGRLLACAALTADTAVGIDVHDEGDLVAAELRRRGVKTSSSRRAMARRFRSTPRR